MNRSNSGNHLAGCNSTDTICSYDYTQRNDEFDHARRESNSSSGNNKFYYNDHNMQLSVINPRVRHPVEISISTDEEDYICPSYQHHQQPYMDKDQELVCPYEALDFDRLSLQDECTNLENKIRYMEEIVDQLERERFHPHVSRTLVDSVLKQRKRLRDVEVELYALELESEPEMNDMI